MDAATLDGIAGRGLMVEMSSGHLREIRGDFHYSTADADAAMATFRREGHAEYIVPVRRIGGRVERMKMKAFINHLDVSTMVAGLIGSGAPVPAGDLEAE